MLRITQQACAAAARRYYASADYYTEGRETRGTWGGLAARRLGLTGPVEPRDFDLLTENRDPRDGSPLTVRKKADRTIGYDFTFSVPKSVSLMHAVTQDERLIDAFRDSVRETMQEIESEMKTRVRRGGENDERTTGNMAWAEFLHFTSRPVDGVPDPQMHMHVFAFNVTHDPVEGRFKAGQFRDLLREAGYWQAAFRVRMANRIQEMGYGVEVKNGVFEIVGASSPELLRRFSRRTDEIETAYQRLLEERLAERGYGVLREGHLEVEGVRQSAQQILAEARRLGLDDPEVKGKLGAATRERKNPELAWQELRREWLSRLTPEEYDAIMGAGSRPRRARTPGGEDRSAAFATNHLFEKHAVVSEKKLLAEALSHGLGGVTVEGIHRAMARQNLIVEEKDGRRLATTPEVLAEEENMLSFARKGRGARPSLYPLGRAFRRAWLNEGQRQAVTHILSSRDRVVLIKGSAGTGKTTLMHEAVEAIREHGQQVVVLAPSSSAARGVLRSEGFQNADTVAAFLRSKEMQETARGGFIWVDEAGLLGSRDMAALFAAADRMNSRVVLMGDRSQHSSPSRGSPLRLLEEAGLPVAAVTGIVRQKRDDYKDAVRCLSEGRTLDGFNALCRLEWVREAPAGERYRLLAEAYVEALEKPGAGGKPATALVVSPKHAEAARITAEIRRLLKEKGKLGEERRIQVWAPMHLTEAQRRESQSYEKGDMVQFHQNAKGIKSGERLIAGDKPFPLEYASRFQAYRPAEVGVAVGDRLRITANGKTQGGHRLNNGDLFTVQGFTPQNDMVLTNGWVIGRDFGHVALGHVVTSHSSQGKTVDTVLIGQSAESYAASSAAQFYVSVSRGRHRALVFTDDAGGLRDAIRKTDERLLATDLVRPGKGPARKEYERFQARQRQAQQFLEQYDQARGPLVREQGREVSHGR